MTKKQFIILVILLAATGLFAQVGVSTTTPNASSQLEVTDVGYLYESIIKKPVSTRLSGTHEIYMKLRL